VCLLIVLMLLSFSHSNAANEHLWSFDNAAAVREVHIGSSSHLPVRKALLYFKLLRNHKPGCSRAYNDTGTAGDITALPGFSTIYPKTNNYASQYLVSWIRPRYYIFLFIYALF